MKLPQHIFALSKNEQRVVIIIMLLLLGGAVTKYYRSQNPFSPAATLPGATPAPSPLEND